MSSHVPLEIELEILKRLPVRSLFRFMCACKTWKSLISCSKFVSGYRLVPTKHGNLLVEFSEFSKEKTFKVSYVCFVDDDTFPQQKLHPAFPPLLQSLDKPRIIGTSCGLFCFYGLLRKPKDYNNQRGMCILWNPTIGKSVGVVVPNQAFGYDIGFGVCPRANDPKLVKILYAYHDEKKPLTKLWFFTLSSGEWRYLSSDPLPPRSTKQIHFQSYPTVIGHFIYWHASIDTGRRSHNLIMSFDVSTDELRELRLPYALRQSGCSISTLRDSLVLLDYDPDPGNRNKHGCDVWMMTTTTTGEAFTKLFTIKAPNTAWTTVGFRTNGQPIIKRFHDSPGAIVVYEPCSGHTKDFGICGTGHVDGVHSYMESLLLLDHDDGHIVSVRCEDVKT